MKKSALVAFISAFAVTGLQAQTVAYVNQTMPTTENSVSIGTLGLDGTSTDSVVAYDFFDAHLHSDSSNTNVGTNIVSSPFPSFISSITPDAPSDFTDPTYSHLTIGGTLYNTGVDYSGKTGAYYNVATIDLGSGTIPSTFTLSLLGDNTNDAGNDSLYQVTLYSGATNTALSGPIQVNTTNNFSNPVNDFYSATVTDAGANDYLIVQAETNPLHAENYTLGGVVVSEAATPEPSTYALLGAGLGLLILMQRLRRRDA